MTDTSTAPAPEIEPDAADAPEPTTWVNATAKRRETGWVISSQHDTARIWVEARTLDLASARAKDALEELLGLATGAVDLNLTIKLPDDQAAMLDDVDLKREAADNAADLLTVAQARLAKNLATTMTQRDIAAVMRVSMPKVVSLLADGAAG